MGIFNNLISVQAQLKNQIKRILLKVEYNDVGDSIQEEK